MSLKKIYENQPEKFEFNEKNLKIAEEILKKYPKTNKKSARVHASNSTKQTKKTGNCKKKSPPKQIQRIPSRRKKMHCT